LGLDIRIAQGAEGPFLVNHLLAVKDDGLVWIAAEESGLDTIHLRLDDPA